MGPKVVYRPSLVFICLTPWGLFPFIFCSERHIWLFTGLFSRQAGSPWRPLYVPFLSINLEKNARPLNGNTKQSKPCKSKQRGDSYIFEFQHIERYTRLLWNYFFKSPPPPDNVLIESLIIALMPGIGAALLNKFEDGYRAILQVSYRFI